MHSDKIAERPARSARCAVTTPVPAAVWQRLTRGRDVLPTQTPAWATAVTRGSGWRDRSRHHLLEDGRELLVPLVGRGRGPGAVLASWPYGWGYGGIVASDGTVTRADVALVLRDLRGLGALRCSITPPPLDPVWAGAVPAACQVPYLTHVLDLRGGSAGVWAGYSSNVRRSVRRAERSGLEVHRDDSGRLLPEFAHLHRLSAQRWAAAGGRSPALARLTHRVLEPPRRLQALSEALGPALTVWHASLDGVPVASVVVLRGSSQVLYWRGAMDRELAARTHANALLHHRAIEEAVADGATSYSFGESDPGSPLAAYKAKFGARPVHWSTLHLERLPVTTALGVGRAAYRAAAGAPGALAATRAARRRRSTPGGDA